MARVTVKLGPVVKEPDRIPSCPLDVQDEAVDADVGPIDAEGTDADAEGRLERVYREQGPRLWRALFMASRSREVADDAVAEAFAQALRRVAFRVAAGELKERGRVAGLADDPVAGMPEPFIDLWRALARLPPKQRSAVVLADYAGWSHREIAKAIGSSVSAVGVHVHRARRRLGDLLEDRDED